MKTKLVALSLLTVALTATAVVAGPFKGPGRGSARGCWEEGRGPGPDRHFARMAEKLGLTAEQKARIQEVHAAEREKVQPLVEGLKANRAKLRELAQAEAFDEGAVRGLALEQANARAELTVSRLKVRSEIHALLTPEQRELAKKLRPFRGRGPHGERGFRGGK